MPDVIKTIDFCETLLNIDTNKLNNRHHGTSKHSGLFDEGNKKFLKNRSFHDNSNCRLKLYTRSHHRGNSITTSKEKRLKTGAPTIKSLKVEGDCKWEILR